MSEDTLFYELPSVPKALNAAEVEALRDVMEHPGWGVFMSIRQIELESSRDNGLSLAASEDERMMHRALYHGFLNDVTFKDRFDEEMASCVPVEKEELSMDF
jgi:hypothetical protein